MICTVLVDSEIVKEYYEKRDCLNWQPLTLIPKDILSYIDAQKNEKNKSERFASYALLFSLVPTFFGKIVENISRDEFGKPYFEKLSSAGNWINKSDLKVGNSPRQIKVEENEHHSERKLFFILRIKSII